MHIAGAHLHGHTGYPSATTAGVAAKRSEDTRRKLFSAADELDLAVTDENAWMIGAWSGTGEHGERPGDPEYDSPSNSDAENSQRLTETNGNHLGIVLEQSGTVGAQAIGTPSAVQTASYSLYAPQAGDPVESTPSGQQVSYWV